MWIPNLPTDGTPIFQQILAALHRAISDGELEPGTRLPPQRQLAKRLGVSVGTITRAYEEADRRGLTIGHVGRGTFIARAFEVDGVRNSGQVIDLSLNYPPMIAAERLLVETWGRVRRRTDFLDALNYGPIEGFPQHRRLASSWLSRTGGTDSADPNRIVVTCGGQASIDLVMNHLCKPGDTILAEALTFSGMKALAHHRGYALLGVAMDAEGIIPDSLSRTAKASGARVLYVMPTLQNPTARSMSLARRNDVLKAARHLKLKIVEDDNYAVYADKSLAAPPLVNLAPDICYYVCGMSKSIAPGLRTGFVVAPDRTSAAAIAWGVRASCFASQAMGPLIAQQAIEDGAAEQIVKENRRILKMRGRQLREVLGLAESPQARCSPHVWLPLRGPEEAARLEARLLDDNVRVTGAEVPVLEGANEFGLRFCIGATRREADFERALGAIRRSRAQPDERPQRAVI
jgi:DNA-binding transcriptional MocR family regulator